MNIHYFDEKSPVSIDLIGGKGLSLISMTNIGLNVPYGFIISTNVWKEFHLLGSLSENSRFEIVTALNKLEARSGLKYGDTVNPLILSARSGARFSMPGMMETILDIGITTKTLRALIRKMGEHAAYSSYQQFLRMFGHTVLKIRNEYFDIEEKKLEKKYSGIKLLRRLVSKFKKVISIHHDIDLEDEHAILILCIESVFESFMSTGAVEYRNIAGIPHDIGTAVIVQQMVFGNLNEKSGSAVVFSRDFESGTSEVTGHYLSNSQGENVVRGFSMPRPIKELPEHFYKKIQTIVRKIEKTVKNVADIEITWEDLEDNSKLYVLQSRVAKVPAKFYFQLQSSLVTEGIKSSAEVLSEVSCDTVYGTASSQFQLKETNELLCTGSPLFTGIGMGKATFSVKRAKKRLKKGEKIVLFCTHFDPNDLELLTGENKLSALVTTEGGPSSHMGLVLNALNIPGVMGISDAVLSTTKKNVTVGGKTIRDLDVVTVDSYEGKVYSGIGDVLYVEKSAFSQEILEKWEKEFGIQNYWADFIDETHKKSISAEFVGNIENSRQYDSKKARQTYLINTCFNPKIAIYTDIIPYNYIDEILSAVEKIKKEGNALWLRSAYSPDLLQSPYTSIDLAQEELGDVKEWFTQEGSKKQYSKFGTYSKWYSQIIEGKKYTMNYALLPHDRKGKLDKELTQEHFVCSLRVERGKATKLIIDIFDGSPHTRVLGQKLPHETMSIVVTANKALPTKVGNYYFRVGKDSFIKERLSKFKNDRAIRQSLENIGFIALTEDDFVNGINKLIENGQLPADTLSDYVQPRKVLILEYVARTIMKDWWINENLMTRIWALSKLTGASVLEVQGRYSEQNKWLLIYGTKGEEERGLLV